MEYSLNGVTLTGKIYRVTTNGYFTDDFWNFFFLKTFKLISWIRVTTYKKELVMKNGIQKEKIK